LLSGCAQNQPLSVHDDNSTAASVRATVRPDSWSRRGGRSEGGIEFGYERFNGAHTQALSTGSSVSIGGQTVNGPDTLQNSATVKMAHIAYTHRFSFGSHFQIEPLIGAARVRLNLNVKPASTGASLHDDFGETFFLFGAMPRWRFNNWLAMEARFTMARVGATRYNNSSLGLLWNPVPSAALSVGYSERNYWQSGYAWTSDYDIKAKGPSASLVFSF